jgi:hypothetical protein
MINITTLYHKYIEKKKKVIYLILKKKPFQKEIIDQLESQLEFKMNEFFDKIIDKIKETKFDNIEQSLKYILLKGLVLILEKELNKNKIDLSEGEKNTLKEIMENDIHENKINEKGNLLFDEKEKEDINNEDNVEKVT